MVLLDTHVWVWWLTGLPQLPSRYRRELENLPAPPFLSVISLWEVSILIEKSRLILQPSPQKWVASASRSDAVQLVQITAAISDELFSLPASLPRDPADRLIAATARALDVPVLTMDRAMLRSGAIRAWEV
jgi:PIN domain nuclease of toxin-antitoxin system